MNNKDLRRWLRLRAARSLPPLFKRLPPSWGRSLSAGIGLLGYVAVGRDRRLARHNLQRVHPEWTDAHAAREARHVFAELGRNIFDFLRYPDLSPVERASLVSIEGAEHLDALRARGQGALLVTAHWGCWEILAAALVQHGYPVRALARPLREPALDAALAAHRRRMGVETYSTRRSPLAAVRHLRSGGFLGALADQRVREAGVSVSFMGRDTRWTEAPARLALAAGAPLVPLGIHRRSDHRHRIVVLPAIDPPRDRDAVEAVTRDTAAALTALIGRSPREWMWIHPRWETPQREPVGHFRRSEKVPAPGVARGAGATDNPQRGREACPVR